MRLKKLLSGLQWRRAMRQPQGISLIPPRCTETKCALRQVQQKRRLQQEASLPNVCAMVRQRLPLTSRARL